MDAAEDRKQYARELEQAAQQSQNVRRIIEQAAEPTRSLGPAAEAGAPGSESHRALLTAALRDEDTISTALGIVQDKTAAAELRAATLQSLAIEVSKKPELIGLLIGLLRDSTEPAVVRLAALRVLQQASFRAAIFNPQRPDYLAALREVIDADDPALRQTALEILAQAKDEYAQRRLLEGLRDPAQALVPPEKAIQLLGYDVHAELYPLLREMVQNPPSARAKQEALRLLGSDPAAKDLLRDTFSDKGESRKARSTSAIALQALAPAEFEQQARQIVLDDAEDDELRATCLSALAHFGSATRSGLDSAFDQQVAQLQQRARSPELRRAAAQYNAMQGGQ